MSHTSRGNQISFQLVTMDRDDEDFGEGFPAESHPLRPTQLTVPLDRDDRAPSMSSSVSDLDAPIYARDITTLPRAGLNAHLVLAILAGALGSAFQHGYNTGVVNAPQKIISWWITEVNYNRTKDTSPLDPALFSSPPDQTTTIFAIIVAITCIGGMIGGTMIGTVADRFGRKMSLMYNNIFVIITVIFEGFAKMVGSYEMLVIGRFFIGVNSGLNAGLVPMYLSEIAPMHLRGAIGTVYQLIITISILIAQILGKPGILGTADLWPLLLCLTIVPAILQCVILPLCPESPKYLLVSKGREADAQRALSWLRGTNDVYDEMQEMRTEYESAKLVPKVALRELFVNSALRIPLVIAVMIMLAQQFSGINAVMNFSTDIFSKGAGLTEDAAINATIGVGAMNVVMTIVSLFLVEKFGRKTLLLVGFIGMAVDTALLTICMSVDSPAAKYMSIVFVILFVVLFATGAGSIPWFLVSELFNQSARPVATSVAIAVNWAANFIVSVSFMPLSKTLGSNVFIIFVVLQILFALFIWRKVPETKNKTIEEISSLFRQQSYQ